VLIAPDLPRIRLLGTSITVINPGWCRREHDPFWRIYRNLDDGAEIRHEGGLLPLRPGRFYVIPACTVFRGSCHGRVRHTFAHFTVAGLPATWLRQAARTPSEVTLPDPALPDLHADRSPAALLAMHALLCRAVAATIAPAEPPRTTPHALSAIAPAMRLAEERPGRPPAVAEMAAAAGVTPDHLARLFAAAIGQTPARWLQERRIALAAERLSAPGASIETIADELGFADRCHFAHVFRRVTGLTPARWRDGGRTA
jgi:AraC-like DNA-binding protein